MAGLSAAARARELGAMPAAYVKGTRPGGSMLLSSCVIWRFRDWDDFRAECPTGDEGLQRVVWERLDEGIEWLEAGAKLVWVIHPGKQTIHAYRKDGTVALFGPNDTLTAEPVLPEFRVPVAELFRLPAGASK